MIPLGPVVARARVRAQRAIVWNYLVDAGLRAAWWPELQVDARLGGTITERWGQGDSDDDTASRDASGDIDVWVDGHAVGFRWQEAGDPVSTAVLLTLRVQGVDTGVTVTETGFDALPMPAERSAASLEGWQSLLADLVAAVDAGAGEAIGVIAGDGSEAVGAAEAVEVIETAEVVETGEAHEPAEAVDVSEASDESAAADVVDEAVVADVGEAKAGEAELPDAEAEEADAEVAKVESHGAEVPETVEDVAGDVTHDAEYSDDEPNDATVPLVLPGPPIGGRRATRDEEESLTGDPDFDALIRGDA